jgi:8-hydroxy-5-deazaflavin:NADPH oxidoreductase
MTAISIIGSGNMATAIGTRAAKHGHAIEVMSRDTARAQALADKIGNGATAGTFGATPLGDWPGLLADLDNGRYFPAS